MRKNTIVLSGGFDPPHVGHVRMLQEARDYARFVIVLVNSDEWLMRKKGFVFMPVEERMEMIRAIEGVDVVMIAADEDDSVCDSLNMIRPDIFGNGGDRKSDNVPEVKLCEELGIELLWNLGGGKVQSSSELVRKANDSRQK